MRRHLTPTEVCERLIGRPEVLSGIVGLQAKAAYGWRHGNAMRDAGDILPRHARALLVHSAARGLGLTAEQLLFGASEDEIDAILAKRIAPAPGAVAA
ncbi:MAG TPA: hypothetical protein PKD10_05300 [Paracoccaceae bacterium]|nr:hypothetical protein [Paracoccaceae bacterium]HMO70109.1 hypothetical protein [Paracoccaceae bacterium]